MVYSSVKNRTITFIHSNAATNTNDRRTKSDETCQIQAVQCAIRHIMHISRKILKTFAFLIFSKKRSSRPKRSSRGVYISTQLAR